MSELILLAGVSGSSATGTTFGPGSGVSGSWIFTVKATEFGGGNVSLQLSDDNGSTWITPEVDGSPNSFSANSMVKIDYIPAEMCVRAILTEATSAVNVFATLTQTT